MVPLPSSIRAAIFLESSAIADNRDALWAFWAGIEALGENIGELGMRVGLETCLYLPAASSARSLAYSTLYGWLGQSSCWDSGGDGGEDSTPKFFFFYLKLIFFFFHLI